jgi:hypothetical protein
VLYNNNELKLTGKPSAGSTYTINGVTYTAAQVGTLTGTLTFNKTAPYLGLGWGNRPGSKLGLSADIGALYQGSPKLSLSATGSVAGLSSNLEQERKSAEEDLGSFNMVSGIVARRVFPFLRFYGLNQGAQLNTARFSISAFARATPADLEWWRRQAMDR